MKPLKKFFQTLLFTLFFIAAAGLILSAFSGYVSPHQFILFSYLGLFFPFILVGNFAVFIVIILFKKWKLFLIHFAIFCICGDAIYSYCPIHKSTKEIPEDAIKILTYNVMSFRDAKKDSKENSSNKILQYILNNDADIVCIQEFGASKTLEEKDFKDVMKKYPHHYFHPMNFNYPKAIFDLGIFSKYPILSVEKVPYESAYNGSFVAELDINGKITTLINNHLESTKLTESDRTNYYQLTKEIGAESLDALTQTLTKRLAPAFKTRASQAELIAQIASENKNPYLIICGDFNDTPISYVRYKIKENLRDAFVDSGSGLGITYNKHRFLFRIDYILHSKNIRSFNATVDKINYSDHYPLWCYLQFREP